MNQQNDKSAPFNIGVIIRSTGERTEKLCLESILKYIDISNISIIKNVSPPYAVYLKQFALMSANGYDYTICIDADIILCADWYHIVVDTIKQQKHNTWFAIVFQMYDAMTNFYMNRGFYVYDNKYSMLSYYFTKCSEYLFKNKYIAEHINSRFTSRIESTIRLYYQCLDIVLVNKKQYILGWHAFEQYKGEIFRQYAIRHYRDPNFKNPKSTPFLYGSISNLHLASNEYIARLGWDNYQIVDTMADIDTIKSKIACFLTQAGISEKTEQTLSLEDFRLKYKNYIMEIANKHHNKYLFRFYKYKWQMQQRIKKLCTRLGVKFTRVTR